MVSPKLIVRNDDVNPNTDFLRLKEIYDVIKSILPTVEIWSCVTVFAGRNKRGSVYGDIPFKDKGSAWIYQHSDCVMGLAPSSLSKVASHGLFHIDHSAADYQTQEMSIVSSCAYLKTKTFVPPFNRLNQNTLDICFDHGIEIIVAGWRSMDCEVFDINHSLWYLHSWRWTPAALKDYLYAGLRSPKNGAGLGQLQEPA